MTTVTCTLNAARAYDFFVSRGLKDFQAAAIVGNLQQESGPDLDPTASGLPREASYGIAQWHDPRWSNLLAFAARTGRDPLTLDVQIEFLWRELETIPEFGLTLLRSTTTIEGAVLAFQDHFERCGDCATESRIRFAHNAFFACPAVQLTAAQPKMPVRKWAAAGIATVLAAGAGYAASKILKR